MKTIRYPVFLLMLVMTATLFLIGGCSRHYVDVYIDNDCLLKTLETDKSIDVLLVFPGDYVIFNNLTNGNVELNLPVGMFEKDKVIVAGGSREILKVIMKEPFEDYMNIECDTGGSGTPKVVIGEEP